MHTLFYTEGICIISPMKFSVNSMDGKGGTPPLWFVESG
jgi:hypothetical protein